MADGDGIRVEVAFALPDRQEILSLEVPRGCTAFDAALRSGITARFAEVDLATMPLGVFGLRLEDPRAYVLREGDRVEIYRPLSIDPKAARRQRARVVRG